MDRPRRYAWPSLRRGRLSSRPTMGDPMTDLTRRRVCAGIATAAGLAAGLGPACGEPLTIRLGYSLAAEEQLWLLMADQCSPRIMASSTRSTLRGSPARRSGRRPSRPVLSISPHRPPTVCCLPPPKASRARSSRRSRKESLHRGFNTTFLALDVLADQQDRGPQGQDRGASTGFRRPASYG